MEAEQARGNVLHELVLLTELDVYLPLTHSRRKAGTWGSKG
ncbi:MULTISPECIES: hypothetical protein [Hydrogenophaga]|nr:MULTISPECIES: hypothetical protein [Hydrogenophaga]